MIEYREASRADAEAIALLHAHSWQRAYRGILRDQFLDNDLISNRRELWRERLRTPPLSQYVLVAEDAATIVGFACTYGNEDVKWGSMLDNLHVRAEASRRGIGRQLLGRAARWSRESYPLCKFYLWVFENNVHARRFYEHLGATDSESVTIEPPGGGQAVECRYTWSDVNALIKRTRV
ncbi:MAG TPA: GNAT family N-acetyltransferase [Steroidobacteraceae bacterium]|nr:GNAT family N-acetyltransferase [Steroidobacteraceae bacterium]